MCRVAAECAHGCCRMCAGLQSYQIFSQISQKYFLAQKNILSKKWPPKQNLKGVSKSYIGLCNHSGPLYKVTWWCMVVPELPKALLKMASGLISPIGHCRQLCNEWFGASYMEYCVFLVVSMSTLLHPSPHIPPVRHRYPNIAIITRPGSRHNLLLCLQPSRIQSQ